MKKMVDDLSKAEEAATLAVLYKAAGTVRGKNANKTFLHDLLTPSERIMLGRRIWIARLLLEGHSQAAISRKLKVGPNTVWRVRQWLEGQIPEYGQPKEAKPKQRRYTDPFSFSALKKKYPMHFLFFPFSDGK